MKVLLFANTDWYLYNFRLPLARVIRGLGIEVILVSPPGKYGQRLVDEGFCWVPLDMDRRSLNPLLEARVIKNLINIYRSEKPDLVHHFTIKSVAYGAFAARVAGIQSVVNAVAGLGYVFTNESKHARLLRPAVKLFLRFVLNGRSTRLILQNPDDQMLFLNEKLIKPDYIRLIRGSGVNTKRFYPRAEDRPEKEVRVLLATRLLWDKGIREYVDAARILRSSRCNARFILAGTPDPGNPAAVSYTDLAKWESEGIVQPIGHCEDVASLLKEIDIVVLPTMYGEGVPRILVEAAASGIPIVATDVPGCREIAEQGVNGLLVQPMDAEGLAQAIRILIDNPEKRKVMGAAGRRIALETYDERIVIKKTIDVYRELLPVPIIEKR